MKNLILMYPPDNSAPPAYSQEGTTVTSTSAAQDEGQRDPDYSGWSQEEVQHQQDAWGGGFNFSKEELLALDKLDWN
ncbi:hypothetical protein B0J17DRAFT_722426 [Rhizoctonia solani]|nr:hypothetical protein B0J17DRAFT_722426 [Rhizoctonia solani]